MNIPPKEPVYIIIPVHNRKNITLKCLENLSQQGSLHRYYIVVVDDGSTDGTTEAIHSLYPDVTVLPGEGNLWWTGAIKKGMEYAYEQGAEYLIWLNDDCIVTKEALNKLLDFSQKDPMSIVGCQGFDLNNPDIIAFGGKVRTWKGYKMVHLPKKYPVTQCDLLSGNLVCIPKTVVEKIGYPQPNVLPHYGGDSLFLIRARKAGFKIFVDPRNYVFNIFGESKLAPNQWLLREGKPLEVIKLIFLPQSLLYWFLWFKLNWEDYSLLGIFTFIYNYSFQVLIPVSVITLLRYFPMFIRRKISDFKQNIQALICT